MVKNKMSKYQESFTYEVILWGKPFIPLFVCDLEKHSCYTLNLEEKH